MLREQADYSFYLHGDRAADTWGVRLTAAGHTRIPAGVSYPPGRHPDDHALDWTAGRVLQTYQLIYVTAGRGRFEADGFGKSRIGSGSMILLFPGVWHRYEPLRAVGWTEDWVELQGPTLDRLRRAGVISPAKPIYRPGIEPALESLYADCHQLVRTTPKDLQAVLGTLGLQILARTLTRPRRLVPANEVTACVNAVRARLAGANPVPLGMKELAEGRGIGYSNLRRAFKAHTGLTMKQYQMEVRFRHAKDQLLNSTLSVKQIADRLGFNSPFHFSADFKRQAGVSPKQWRLRHGGAARRSKCSVRAH